MQREEVLVQQIKEGNQDAFNQIYNEYFTRIYRYVCLKVGSGGEAEDICQEVFTCVFKSISSFNWKGSPFSSWLFRIAHNQIIDYYRRKGRRATVPLESWDMVDNADGPQEITEQEFDIKQVSNALKKLTKAQQEVISLRFASDLPIAEVAKAMGKSEGAIKAMQHSAVIALRKALAGEQK